LKCNLDQKAAIMLRLGKGRKAEVGRIPKRWRRARQKNVKAKVLINLYQAPEEEVKISLLPNNSLTTTIEERSKNKDEQNQIRSLQKSRDRKKEGRSKCKSPYSISYLS